MNPTGAKRSFLEASYGLQSCLSERIVFDADTVGSFPLDFSDTAGLSEFAASILWPVERHDKEHGSALLASLRVFLENNRRWQAAAENLRIHRHTLAYRMELIEQLTGRKLSSMSDVLELWLALKIKTILEH